jgi:hypothetical protein
MTSGVKEKILSTDRAKSFLESEEYKKIDKMRKEMNEFKHNLKEEIDNT